MAPVFCVSLYAWVYAQDNPAFTATQVSLEFMPDILLLLIPAIAGCVLFHSGMEDYDDE